MSSEERHSASAAVDGAVERSGGGGVQQRTRTPLISVVIPVFACRPCLQPLNERLGSTLTALVGDEYEVIYVDDRSPDGAWTDLRQLAKADPHVRAVRLSRNFGQHAAITAGLSRSRGYHTVVMDGDLEEPPEVIAELYQQALAGHDVVNTTRKRTRRSPVRALVGRTYLRLRNALLGARVGTEHGTLSMISRPVVDAFLQLRDNDREYLIALTWLGYDTTTVEFERQQRPYGQSAYTWRRLARVAVDGLFFQTTVLLRWVVFTGLLISLTGGLLAAYHVYNYFAHEDHLPGYTSIAVLLLLLGGFTIFALGVVGMYVGKVFEQVKGRPLYLVSEEIG